MDEGKRDGTLFVTAAVFLVLKFIWRLMPVDELPSTELNLLTIGLELALVVGLIGLAPRVLRSVPEGSGRSGWIFLLVAGVAAALGIFGLRLAGGPIVELPPRSPSESPEADGLRKQLHGLISSANKAVAKIQPNRWVQAVVKRDAAEVRKLTRQDFQEVRNGQRELRDYIERILDVFAQAESKGISLPTERSVGGATKVETWRAALEASKAGNEEFGLIEQHWDEWVADPFPAADSDLKPWRREVNRLADVAAAASQKFEALLTPRRPLPHRLHLALSWICLTKPLRNLLPPPALLPLQTILQKRLPSTSGSLPADF